MCLQVTPAVVFDMNTWPKLHTRTETDFTAPIWYDPSPITTLLDSKSSVERDKSTQTARYYKNKLHKKYVLGISSPSQRSKRQWMKLKNSPKHRRNQCLFCWFLCNTINYGTKSKRMLLKTEQSWQVFKDVFHRAQELSIPKCKKSGREGKRPAWPRQEMLVKLRKKRELHRQWKTLHFAIWKTMTSSKTHLAPGLLLMFTTRFLSLVF